jgi:hypothetical protein
LQQSALTLYNYDEGFIFDFVPVWIIQFDLFVIDVWMGGRWAADWVSIFLFCNFFTHVKSLSFFLHFLRIKLKYYKYHRSIRPFKISILSSKFELILNFQKNHLTFQIFHHISHQCVFFLQFSIWWHWSQLIDIDVCKNWWHLSSWIQYQYQYISNGMSMSSFITNQQLFWIFLFSQGYFCAVKKMIKNPNFAT